MSKLTSGFNYLVSINDALNIRGNSVSDISVANTAPKESGHIHISLAVRWFLGSLMAAFAVATTYWIVLSLISPKIDILNLTQFLALAAASHLPLFLLAVGLIETRKQVSPYLKTKKYSVAHDSFGRGSAVVIDVRRRARRLRRSAALTLAMMVSALTSGLLLFYKAEDISSNSSARLSDAMDKMSAQTKWAGEAQDRFRYLVDRLEPPSKDPSYQKRLLGIVDDTGREIASSAKRTEAYISLIEKQLAALNSVDQNRRLISTITTRVGAVLILIFLAQILGSLYRYNMRLAAYYESRADSLETSIGDNGQVDTRRLKDMTTVIAPESIAFGREPRSPAEAGAEIAASLLMSKRKVKTPIGSAESGRA